MKLQVKASHLLDAILHLSKISKLNETNKSLLIDADNGYVEVLASSYEMYGQGIIDADIVEPGTVILPLTVIPYLQGFGEKVIGMDINLDNVILYERKNKVKLPQIGGNILNISRRDYRPVWEHLRVDRIANIHYAAGIGVHGLNYMWFTGNSILCSDRYRIALYTPKAELPDGLSIQTMFTKFLPKTEINMYVGKEIWFGNDALNISIPRLADNPIPGPLRELSNSDRNIGCALINTAQLKFAAESAKRLMDNMFFSCDISIVDDDLLVFADTPNGVSDIKSTILLNEFRGDLNIRVNTKSLNEAIENCVGKQVEIGIFDIGIPLLLIRDVDVEHYILPLIK